MVFGRPNAGRRVLAFADVEDMAEAVADGAVISWKCHGDCTWRPWGAADYLARVGPRYCAHNEISVCPECGAPRTLCYQPAQGSPYRPLKDEGLWLMREVGFGRDPDAWFEIEFMEPEPPTTSRPPRRSARG